MKVVLASSNPGKIKEFQSLLHAFSIELVPQDELGVSEIAETGLSFVENALIKARHAAKTTGLPALADDSGLVVPALGGAPGIYSARYAGAFATSTENLNKLLTALQPVPENERRAHFYCVLALMFHGEDPAPLICEGRWSGAILPRPRGSGGFGYDPVFYIPALCKTAAELSAPVKNSISHRGIALQLLLKKLADKI